MKNFFLDVILFALFVAEMCFQFLPKILHEILGVAMFAGIIFHVAINRRRFVSPAKKFTAKKILSVALNVALTICAAIIFVTGVCMSNYLFVDVITDDLQRNMTLHQLHVSAPYVMMILIGVHVGLHWTELRQRFLNIFGLTEIFQRQQKFFTATAVVLSIVGICGLYLNRVGDRILMKHIFGTPATELPAIIFALMIVGGVALFALITVLLDRK
ncbi:MAG: DUF4405 domain-containing protein [Selenomonadaceae bacterium]|nr:DUF4405 domain-containing protein [Selenomonadaceae bacterium]